MQRSKSKKLTNAQKKLNMQIKKELQDKGTIPPDKKRLNRKKFIDDQQKAWNARTQGYIWEIHLLHAVGIMLHQKETKRFTPSLEAVGAAKVIALALRMEEFREKLKSEGRTSYTVEEEYNYIKDIISM